MRYVKNTKNVTTFLRFFVLLPYLTNLICCIEVFVSDLLLDEFVLLRSTFLLVHFFLLYSWAPSQDLKKGNHFSFLLFFYLLMFLSIIFLFDAYFSLISTYFCFIFLVDQCFSFRSTFLLVRDLLNLCFSFRSISLLNGLFALRFLFPCILFDEFFSSQIYLSFGWCFALRALSNFTNTKKVIRILFFFRSSTIFSNLLCFLLFLFFVDIFL